MPGVDDDRPIILDVQPASGPLPHDSAPDAIELGPPGPRWSRWWRSSVVGPVCVALVVGALAGYLFEKRAQPQTGVGGPVAVTPTPRSLVPGGGQPPTGTGNRCSLQRGDTLQLGIEVVNLSTVGTTLLKADVALPMGGLRLTATAWGSCGQLSTIDGADPYPLPAGATTWLRMTFDVLIACPAPYPVQFTLTYSQAGNVADAELGGFSDLGDVPYTGCTPGPG